MVYQHFMLVDSFSVAENVVLSQQRWTWRTDVGAVERDLSALGQRYGLEVDPKAKVWQLSVGEIGRAHV